MRRLLLALLFLGLALPAAPASGKPKRKKPRPRPAKPEPAAEEEATEPDSKPDGKADSKPDSSKPDSSKPAAGKPDSSKPASATPAAETTGKPAAPPAPDINAPPPPAEGAGRSEAAAGSIDVDSLRKEYLALRDQLFRSRARAAALGSALYSTRIRLHLDYKSARFYTITRAVIRLDGASVFDDTQGAIAADGAPRFDGFVAPGRHQVTVRIEATGKDDQRFTSALESSFVVQAPPGKDVIVKCTAADEGDIPYEWKKSEEGSYKLRLDVAIDTRKREAGGGKRAAR